MKHTNTRQKKTPFTRRLCGSYLYNLPRSSIRLRVNPLQQQRQPRAALRPTHIQIHRPELPERAIRAQRSAVLHEQVLPQLGQEAGPPAAAAGESVQEVRQVGRQPAVRQGGLGGLQQAVDVAVQHRLQHDVQRRELARAAEHLDTVLRRVSAGGGEIDLFISLYVRID